MTIQRGSENSAAGRLAFLFGFDRSGTTALARVLGTHPETELLMQPFNSSEFRERMYEILDSDTVSSGQRRFIAELCQGRIDTGYIKSPWFFKYSTTDKWSAGKLHIIKSTISHFIVPWITNEFPDISVWGIWRHPVAVIDSVFRNGFQTWYEGAVPDLQRTVQATESLHRVFPDNTFDQLSPVGTVALNLAIRSVHLFQHLPPGNVIWYDEFTESPNAALRRFASCFQLGPMDASQMAGLDLNMSGRRTNQATALSHDDIAEIHRITEPVIQVLKSRHGSFRLSGWQ